MRTGGVYESIEVYSMKLQAYYAAGDLVPEGEEETQTSFLVEGGRHFWKKIGEPFEIEIKR